MQTNEITGTATDDGSCAGSRRQQVWLRGVRRAGYAVFGAQLVVMVGLDHALVAHWDTTSDLGGYAQAWTLIAHGHLDPYSTIWTRPFWKNHLELAMWPLSLLYWLHHSPETLKWVQSAALVGAEVVGFRWVLAALGRHRRPGLPVAAGTFGLVALEVFNPQLYGADWFDFHMEILSLPLILLAARALYDGRSRPAVLWSALALTCGDVAGLYVGGLGLAAVVCSRRTRPVGALLAVGGGAWVALAAALGASQGSALGSFQYLANGGKAGMGALLIGLVAHPRAPLHVLRTRQGDLLNTIRGGGTLGIFSPWVLFLVAAAVLPAALSTNLGYITAPFQFVLATVAVPVGTVLTLEWLGRRRPLPRAQAAASVLGVVVLGATLAWSLPKLSTTRSRWFVTSPAQAAVLDRVRSHLPAGVDLVVSENVVGGFAQYPGVIDWGWAPQTAVKARPGHPLVFVFVDNRLAVFTPAQAAAAGAYVRNHLHAAVLADRHGVQAYQWSGHPRQRSRRIILPGA